MPEALRNAAKEIRQAAVQVAVVLVGRILLHVLESHVHHGVW